MNTQAEVMDRLYHWQRGIYDATRKYYLLKRDTLIDDLHPPTGGTVLEIGCGTGRNLIKAAKRYPDCRFYGVDISEAMLDVARQSIMKAGLQDRVKVGFADATRMDAVDVFGPSLIGPAAVKPAFDRVFFSYTLSMIPDWQTALDCAAGQVAKGGALMVVDFGLMAELPRWFKRGLLAWLRAFHTVPRQDLEQVWNGLATSHNLQVACAHPLGGYAFYGQAIKR